MLDWELGVTDARRRLGKPGVGIGAVSEDPNQRDLVVRDASKRAPLLGSLRVDAVRSCQLGLPAAAGPVQRGVSRRAGVEVARSSSWIANSVCPRKTATSSAFVSSGVLSLTSASGGQHLRGLEITNAGSEEKRRIPSGRTRANIRATLDEPPGDGRVPLGDRPHEGSCPWPCAL